MSHTNLNLESFGRAYRSLVRPLRYFAWRYMQNEDIARDIADDVLLEFYHNDADLEQTKVQSQVYRAVKWVCIDRLINAGEEMSDAQRLAVALAPEEDDPFFNAVLVEAEWLNKIDEVGA
ncbi:RNA polymerase sigma factor [Puia dinghuensis]|uniref:Uncharacterized protein n=1 Tax=Puia dinghuensis TaxID=1792502 RepID=A0A8J2XVM7_9BACT|nr:hypothetical protein [Puia dinghuensis]GGB19777.1 hypothetical protein GCM10011511_49400 [Puia dinghuensis]